MARPEIAMTDSASHSSIPDDAAMLIERAVRGELSPEERSRLDALMEADPVVAEELERAKREEEAMNTAAMLLSERSDPERMRMAIEQKLGMDLRMIRMYGGVLIVAIPIYIFMLHGFAQNYALIAWIGLVPLVPVVIHLVLMVRRRRAFQRAAAGGDPAIASEFSRHLSRSRKEHTIVRAGLIITYIGLPLIVLDDIVAGNYARAIVLAVFFLILLASGWKTAFSRRQQERFDKFFEGRLTIEQLFDKRAESAESDAE